VGEYVNAGGVRTYYEVYGEGEPLVLLHGGLATAESWGKLPDQLRKPSPTSWGVFYPSSRRASSATAGSTSLSKSAYLTLMVSVWVPARKTIVSSSVNVSST
jgi:pimeloyl-ACP methyl ester carboxylesterase